MQPLEPDFTWLMLEQCDGRKLVSDHRNTPNHLWVSSGLYTDNGIFRNALLNAGRI